MTVISVTATDPGLETVHWAVPQDNQLNMSPIPRGLRRYRGQLAVAALGANDETSVVITLTFPGVFAYLFKSVTIGFQSDDLTSEFSNFGHIIYQPGGVTNLNLTPQFGLTSDGQAFRDGVSSVQIYRPMGTWRQWIRGNEADTVTLRIGDVSNDTSTAGDMFWQADVWEYDIEQCLKWPVNTPIPQISY